MEHLKAILRLRHRRFGENGNYLLILDVTARLQVFQKRYISTVESISG
jgi:hypothetical protein